MTEHRYLGRCQKNYGGCGQRLSIVLTTEAATAHKGSHWVTCPECNKRALLKLVEGEYNPDHKCDPRCTGAVGNHCSCACGGANHGADHDMRELVAVDRVAKAETTSRFFIGEIGKHIVGEVTVTQKAVHAGDGQRKLPYNFVTKDGSMITWWVPDFITPEWEVGEKFTLRAKVKDHRDHKLFGKSTTVIYAEKVNS